MEEGVWNIITRFLGLSVKARGVPDDPENHKYRHPSGSAFIDPPSWLALGGVVLEFEYTSKEITEAWQSLVEFLVIRHHVPVALVSKYGGGGEREEAKQWVRALTKRALGITYTGELDDDKQRIESWMNEYFFFPSDARSIMDRISQFERHRDEECWMLLPAKATFIFHSSADFAGELRKYTDYRAYQFYTNVDKTSALTMSLTPVWNRAMAEIPRMIPDNALDVYSQPSKIELEPKPKTKTKKSRR